VIYFFTVVAQLVAWHNAQKSPRMSFVYCWLRIL